MITGQAALSFTASRRAASHVMCVYEQAIPIDIALWTSYPDVSQT